MNMDKQRPYVSGGSHYPGGPGRYPPQHVSTPSYPGVTYPGAAYPGAAYPGVTYPNPVYTQQPGAAHAAVAHAAVLGLATNPILTPGNDHLFWSIFSCLFCFWPLGLIAIIFSLRSRDAVSRGQLEEAKGQARVAMGLNIASLVAGIISIIVIIALSTVNTYYYY